MFFRCLFFFSLLSIISCEKKNKKECTSINEDKSLLCKTYRNGYLYKVENFDNDTFNLYGSSYEFSPQGDTLKKAYYKNNRRLGGYYEYYHNGSPKMYICFDSFHEDTMFYRKYSDKGTVIYEEGEILFGKGYTSYNKLHLADSNIFTIMSVIVAPPKTNTSVTSFIINKDNQSDTIIPINQYYMPNQNQLVLNTDFKIVKSGKYIVYTKTIVNDSVKQMIIQKREKYELIR